MKGIGNWAGFPNFPFPHVQQPTNILTRRIGTDESQFILSENRQRISWEISELERLRARPDLSRMQKAALERQMANQIRNEILNLSTFEFKSPSIRRVSTIQRPVKPHITETTAMLKSLKAWDHGLYHVQGFSPAQLAQFEVKDQGGKLSSLGGVLFNTTALVAGHSSFIYVLSPQGKIYAHPPYETNIHHSSFLSGGPVATAGEIRTNNRGHVTMVNNKSGHYRGNAKSLAQMVLELKERGAFARDALVDFMGLGAVKASMLLAYLTPNLSNEQVTLLVQMLPKFQS